MLPRIGQRLHAWAQIDQERAEKLDLMHKVRVLEKDLEHRECEIDELRTHKLRQSRRYDELWRSHDELLIEAQKLRSQVSVLNSDRGAEGQAINLEVQAISQRSRERLI